MGLYFFSLMMSLPCRFFIVHFSLTRNCSIGIDDLDDPIFKFDFCYFNDLLVPDNRQMVSDLNIIISVLFKHHFKSTWVIERSAWCVELRIDSGGSKRLGSKKCIKRIWGVCVHQTIKLSWFILEIIIRVWF